MLWLLGKRLKLQLSPCGKILEIGDIGGEWLVHGIVDDAVDGVVDDGIGVSSWNSGRRLVIGRDELVIARIRLDKG